MRLLLSAALSLLLMAQTNAEVSTHGGIARTHSAESFSPCLEQPAAQCVDAERAQPLLSFQDLRRQVRVLRLSLAALLMHFNQKLSGLVGFDVGSAAANFAQQQYAKSARVPLLRVLGNSFARGARDLAQYGRTFSHSLLLYATPAWTFVVKHADRFTASLVKQQPELKDAYSGSDADRMLSASAFFLVVIGLVELFERLLNCCFERFFCSFACKRGCARRACSRTNVGMQTRCSDSPAAYGKTDISTEKLGQRAAETRPSTSGASVKTSKRTSLAH